MLKNRLTFYIFISVLIHAGFLLGMHSFLSLPDAELEPPVLIPVEVVVLREQPPDPALKITVSEPMATMKQDSIARSQLSADMDADQVGDQITDPVPAEGNYQPSVSLETNDPPRVSLMASEGQKPAGQLDIAFSQSPPLHLSPTDGQLYEVPPSAKEGDSTPRLTAGTMPTSTVTPTAPKGKEIASEPVILAFQMSSLHLSAVEPLSPAESTPLDISTSADLVEAKAAANPHFSQNGKEVASEPVDLAIQAASPDLSAVEPSSPAGSTPSDIGTSADLVAADAAVSPHFSQASQKAVTSLVDTRTGDDFVSELPPLPKEVESEPVSIGSTLQVQSQPNGAQVYVNGESIGETPLALELPLGKHEVRLALPDYYGWDSQINLTERNQAHPVLIRLRSLRYRSFFVKQ